MHMVQRYQIQGCPLEAFDASFFFIDMVGLSDPTLSVGNQVHKIEILNELIRSCDAYQKGICREESLFYRQATEWQLDSYQNWKSRLSSAFSFMESYKSIIGRESPAEEIGVRIGLASGPVFAVADLNNVQNIWGPGIILARRVMDAGDKGHILISQNLAEVLLSLKDDTDI